MSALLTDLSKRCELWKVFDSNIDSKNINCIATEEFVEWSKTHFPEVKNFTVTKDYFVHGLTWDNKTIYSLKLIH